MVARSILGARSDVRRLSEQTVDERAWLERLVNSVRTAALDMPRLLLRLDEADDPAAATSFESDWQAASTRFSAERTAAVLGELSARLAIP